MNQNLSTTHGTTEREREKKFEERLYMDKKRRKDPIV